MNSDDPKFDRAFKEATRKDKLTPLSFAELAAELTAAHPGSAPFLVIEREMKRRLAQDQAKVNRSNVLLGVLIGGAFTIIGTFLGAYLRSCPSCQYVAPTSVLQQAQQGQLGTKANVASVPASQPVMATVGNPPGNAVSPVPGNTKASNAHP